MKDPTSCQTQILKCRNESTSPWLQESAKCPPVEYIYDMELDLSEGETINETVEVDYEYSYDINVSVFHLYLQRYWIIARFKEMQISEI